MVSSSSSPPSKNRWLGGNVSRIASRVYFVLIIFQIPLFRIPCRSGLCTTPIQVTSSQLIANEIFPAPVVKALLYPGAVVRSLATDKTLPNWSNLLDAFNLTEAKNASPVVDLQRLEVLAGSYFSVAGALVGLISPGRMTLFGTLLVVWGLVKEGVLGKPANTDVYMEIQALLNALLRIYKSQRQEQELMHSEVIEEIIFGLESGILFGMASVISKMGFVLTEQGFSKLMVPVCISISFCCSATGFIYQTRGLKHGRAIVVSTCAAVAAIVTGVLAGMIALGEQMPSSPAARMSLLLGWFFIILGVILLVSSSRLISLLPRRWQRYLKSNLERNHSLRRFGSVRTKDPTSPSAIIHTSTLHHLITSPAKTKP